MSTGTLLKTSAQIASRRTKFGYTAIDSTLRRRSPVTRTAAEVFSLTGQRRQTASATARDDRRNFTVLAWMVRRHLDGVSRFTPHIRLADPTVTAIVKTLLAWHGKRRQFDALGKHGRDEFMRMFEACKVIEGDAGALKTAGGKLQGIEGDRIAIPNGGTGPYSAGGFVFNEDGIAKDVFGKREAFCICKRGGYRGAELAFERAVADADLIYDGYWPDRFDSDRGVSPLLSALNEAADVRETREWLVLKAKASALFGLAFTRTGSDDPLPGFADSTSDTPTTEPESYAAQVERSVKSRGTIMLDLDPGDTVAEIESKTPNPAVVEFTRELTRSVLLALDIPFTFYDSLTASFSARIADRNEYEESCEPKRDKNIGVLDEIYGGWLLPMWAEADLFGFGTALAASKISVEEVAASLRWVPAGRPWLDKTGEVTGSILSIAAGLSSPQRECAKYGEDAYEIADEIKDYLKNGAPVFWAQGGQMTVQSLVNAAVQNGNQKDKSNEPGISTPKE